MSDIITSLRRLGFPESCKSALDHLASSSAKGDAGIPGLGSSDDLAEQIANEFIFGESPGRGLHAKKSSALHELQIHELLLSFHGRQDVDEWVKHAVFRAVFVGHLPPPRATFLAKLVSMAIGVRNRSILDCAAVWMQRNGGNTDSVSSIVSTIVNDYCHLVPSAASSLILLPQLSLHFACNFITALTALYTPASTGTGRPVLPSDLLDMVTKWIEDDSQLCLISLRHAQNNYMQPQRSSLWTSPTKPNTQTPIPGLVKWTTQAPLAHRLNALRSPPASSQERSEKNGVTDSMSLVESKIWSRLHLGLLQSFQAFPTIPGANQLELLTLADMFRIVKDVSASISEINRREGKANDDNKATGSAELAEASVNRLVQILQVSLKTGSFRCSLSDLQNICRNIPPNKLLAILESQHLARKPPPMHYETS